LVCASKILKQKKRSEWLNRMEEEEKKIKWGGCTKKNKHESSKDTQIWQGLQKKKAG